MSNTEDNINIWKVFQELNFILRGEQAQLILNK